MAPQRPGSTKWRRPVDDDANEWTPPAWHEWQRLYRIAPQLRIMHEGSGIRQKRPPRPMADAAFLAFAACFGDTVKRKVLAALMLDLMADDLIELITAAAIEREESWQTKR